MKRIFASFMAVAVAFVMVLGFGKPIMAEDAKGSLTINGTKAGKTVELYQLFSATKSGDNLAYTLHANFAAFFQDISSIGNKEGDSLSNAAYDYVSGLDSAAKQVAFVQKLLEWVEDKDIASFKTVATTADTTTVSDLTYGYYLVYPKGATDTANGTHVSVQSPAMLVSIHDTATTINMKSTYPTVDKVIVDGEDKKASDVNIGDTVTFKLTSVVPDMTGYRSYSFKLKDTLSDGLTFGNISSVKIGANDLTEDNTDKPKDNTYTLTKNGQNLTVAFNNFISNKNLAGTPIEVRYTAILNAKAVSGMDKNTNSARVEYSNDPANTATGIEESEPSVVDVHTFDFTIYKYYLTNTNDAESKTPLAGAQFELYKEDNTKINLIDLTGGNYRQATSDETSAEGFSSAIITSDDDGKVKVSGLAAGTYKLKENKAPDGYNKLIGDVTIKIEPTYNTSTQKLENVKVTYTIGDITSQPITITGKGDSPEIPIENKSGSVLPDTGGNGTMMFTIVGVGILAVMISCSVISRKRRRA